MLPSTGRFLRASSFSIRKQPLKETNETQTGWDDGCGFEPSRDSLIWIKDPLSLDPTISR